MMLSLTILGFPGSASATRIKNESLWTAEVTGTPRGGLFSCELVKFSRKKSMGHPFFTGDMGGDWGFWTSTGRYIDMTWVLGVNDTGLDFDGTWSKSLNEYVGDFGLPNGGGGVDGVLVMGDVGNC
jgi:hypothetical protein